MIVIAVEPRLVGHVTFKPLINVCFFNANGASQSGVEYGELILELAQTTGLRDFGLVAAYRPECTNGGELLSPMVCTSKSVEQCAAVVPEL